MDCSLPGFSVHRIVGARILEWTVISSSKKSCWLGDRPRISCNSCIGRQILYHWTTWKTQPQVHLLLYTSSTHSNTLFTKFAWQDFSGWVLIQNPFLGLTTDWINQNLLEMGRRIHPRWRFSGKLDKCRCHALKAFFPLNNSVSLGKVSIKKGFLFLNRLFIL